MQLTKNVLIEEVGAPVSAANNTDQNTDILDMSGWDGVVFLVPVVLSVAGGVATLKVEGNTVNSDTGMAALTGAAAAKTSATANTLLIVDVYRPVKRYLQGVVTSATQEVTFGNTIAIRYCGDKAPITNGASVATATAVVGV